MKAQFSITNYPAARQEAVVDDYHGVPVKDPFRWLENPESEEVKAWTEAQNALTEFVLSQVPERDWFILRLKELWDFPKYASVQQKGERFFFTKQEGSQNQAVLYIQEGWDGEPSVLLDPNQLSEDGTVSLMEQSYTDDGSLVAYLLTQSGSDWQTLHIMDINSRQQYPEVIEKVKFANVVWKGDHTGFFYNRIAVSEKENLAEVQQDFFSQVFWHTLGTPQSQDLLVFEMPEDRGLSFAPLITDDHGYLLLYVHRGTDPRNGIYYRPMDSRDNFVRLLEPEEAQYDFLGNIGSRFIFSTNLAAPRNRIIEIDIERPARENWLERIPQGSDTLDQGTLVQDRLVLSFLKDASHCLRIYTCEGESAGEIPLPSIGTVVPMHNDSHSSQFFFGFSSFLYPNILFYYDFTTHSLQRFQNALLPLDGSRYETRQVFYPSKDGTKIPMFLTMRKDLPKDGNTPTILYGYGGFTLSQTPFFNVWNLLWLELGGILAVANLRGGYEYGEEWHQAGMLSRKQNVFDDFIAAAEWLIDNGYTCKAKLAIEGRSNGGLLTAACYTQRPDLYGAVLCHVPVIDMLRYHKFTIGRYWIPEYGNAEADPEQFKFLIAYSPLHNIRQGELYPPILVTSADTDDRVVPAHAKKFVATLQAKAAPGSVILTRIETRAGHGFGKPADKIIAERADILAFLVAALDMHIDRER